jgi:hypothetical protein
MPRPRRDGTPARQPNRRKLSELYVQKLQRKPPDQPFLTWDTIQGHLALVARPSGHLSYKMFYHHGGRLRWYRLGNHKDIRHGDLPPSRQPLSNLILRRRATKSGAACMLGRDVKFKNSAAGYRVGVPPSGSGSAS